MDIKGAPTSIARQTKATVMGIMQKKKHKAFQQQSVSYFRVVWWPVRIKYNWLVFGLFLNSTWKKKESIYKIYLFL